jgi:hypothetical protein
MTWLTLKAWPWFKKYWKWFLFPIGIIIYIVGYSTHKKSMVVAPSLLGAAEDKLKAEEKAREETTEAKEKRDEALAAVEKEHAETVAKLTDEQRAKMESLRKEPDKLNEFLVGVGKSIRS